MKKRFLSILLTLSMVIGLAPMTLSTAVAGEPAQQATQQIDRTGWIDITTKEDPNLENTIVINESGKYYLTSDVTGKKVVVNMQDDNLEPIVATIDLNGHVLKGNGENPVIINQGQLTITDNNPTIEHKYVVDADALWVWNDEATGTAVPYEELTTRPAAGTVISVKGGCITGGNAYKSNEDFGGGISCDFGNYLNDRKLSISNINVIGNKATNGGGIGSKSYDSTVRQYYADNIRVMGNTASTDAGGIYAGYCVNINLSNSTISYNTAATNAGGIEVEKNTVIDSCIISYNESKGVTGDHNKGIGGGGLFQNKGEDLIINQSEISHNISANDGGGILLYQINDHKYLIQNTIIEDNTARVNGGGVYYTNDAKCFAAGTLITMADGTTKKIEEISEGDVVKTFDHESGEISSAEVYLAYKGEKKAVPFTLNFEDGNKLSIAGIHDLLVKDSLSYVRITEDNAESFVGEEFYGEDGAWHKLTSVTKETTAAYYYSIYTAAHQNCFASGLLSCPDDVDHILNIYDLDKNLKADDAQLKSDIETYGLVSFEYANDNYGIPSEWYDVAGVKYLFISLGKGLVTLEELESVWSSVEEEAGSYAPAPMMTSAAPNYSPTPMMTSAAPSYSPAPMMTSAAPMMATSGNDKITIDNYSTIFSDVSEGCISIGPSTKIVNNTVSGSANNLWLDESDQSVQDLAELYGGDDSDILVGVTLQDGTGKFTTESISAPTHCFFSDNDDYGVKHTNNYLEIVPIDYNTTPKMDYSAKLTLSKNFDIGLGVRKNESSAVSIDEKKLTIYADGKKIELSDKFEGTMAKVESKNIGTPTAVSVEYDGVIIKGFTYSVKKYCEAAFEAYEGDTEKYAKLNTLCEAIVNYGKYAEDYVNKNSKSTVNAGHAIDPATITVPESAAKFVKNATYGGEDSFATIYPDSTLKLTYILNSSFAYDNSNTKTQNFYILNQDLKQITPSKVSVSCDAQSSKVTITIELYAYQLANEYTLKVKGVDATVFTLSYGVYDYCSDVVGGDYGDATKNLCKMIYNYGEAVQDYIG